jgi:nicotinic acid mononucleotide adenylyltransferase
MNRAPQMLRLTPQAAGALQQQCTKATIELLELTRFRKEFDRQLVALVGIDALRKLNKDTKNALLLADLVKEAA